MQSYSSPRLQRRGAVVIMGHASGGPHIQNMQCRFSGDDEAWPWGQMDLAGAPGRGLCPVGSGGLPAAAHQALRERRGLPEPPGL